MMKDSTAVLLAHLIEKFHQKYELKLGYAEFLLKQLMQEATDEVCAYGCLTCLSKFGPYINSKILLPQVPTIAAQIKSKLADTDQTGDAKMEVLTPARQEMLQRNLFLLEQIKAGLGVLDKAGE